MNRTVFLLLCSMSAVAAATGCSGNATEAAEPPYAQATVLEPGLDGREDIIFFEDFETETWKERWTAHWDGWNEAAATVTDEPFAGLRCLASISKPGEHETSGSGEYILAEPLDEIYMRLYLRLEPGFRMGTCNQLKLFGCTAATTLDKCYGGAGERPDGTKFYINMALSTSLELHFYYYHLNQSDNYGDWRYADKEGRVKLEPGRWYAIECRVKANDIGAQNGEMQCWVDGELRGEVTGISFRTVAEAGFRRLTIINYYGGAGAENTAPRRQRTYIENVVYARDYIGPMKAD